MGENDLKPRSLLASKWLGFHNQRSWCVECGTASKINKNYKLKREKKKKKGDIFNLAKSFVNVVFSFVYRMDNMFAHL